MAVNEDKSDQETKINKPKRMSKKESASSGLVYCLGLIGAAIFYIDRADSFGTGVLGFLKAIVWPAMLVFRALEKLYS